MSVTHDSFHAYSTTTENDDEEEEEEEEEEYLAPVRVHIDASMRIDGQSNILILGPPNAVNSNNTGASPCADQPSNIQASARQLPLGVDVHMDKHV